MCYGKMTTDARITTIALLWSESSSFQGERKFRASLTRAEKKSLWSYKESEGTAFIYMVGERIIILITEETKPWPCSDV